MLISLPSFLFVRLLMCAIQHAKTLEKILLARPTNKAWLERSGVDVDELMNCLTWTPAPLVVTLPASTSAPSVAVEEPAPREAKADERAQSLIPFAPASSSTPSVPPSSEGCRGDEGGSMPSDLNSNPAPERERRQRMIREVRRENRRNMRKVLESTRKVDEVSNVFFRCHFTFSSPILRVFLFEDGSRPLTDLFI